MNWPAKKILITKLITPAVISLFAMVILFTRLDRIALYPWDEARFAEITYELSENHDWLNLTFNQRSYLRKPPLYFWLSGATFNLLGSQEFAGRFWTTLLGLLTVITVYYIGTNMFDSLSGVFAALILLATPLFFKEARTAQTDIPLTFLLTCSLYCFYLSREKSKYLVPGLFFVGLAIMTKSAAGLIPLGIAGVYLVTTGNFAVLKNRYLPPGLILLLAIVIPWHAYQLRAYPGQFFESYFSHQVYDRMVRPLESHSGGLFYYLSILFSRVMPWSLVFVLGLKTFWREERYQKQVRYLLTWFLTILIAFSLFGTKSGTYIIPLLPPLALLCGYYFRTLTTSNSQKVMRTFNWLNIVLGLASLAIMLILTAHYFLPGLAIFPLKFRLAYLNAGRLIAFWLLLLVSSFFYPARTKQTKRRLAVFLLLFIVSVAAVNLEGENLEIIRDPYRDVRAVALASKALTPPGKTIYSRKITAETLSFYSRHRIEELDRNEEIENITANGDYYFILPAEQYQGQRSLFPSSEVIYQEGGIVLIKDVDSEDSRSVVSERASAPD